MKNTFSISSSHHHWGLTIQLVIFLLCLLMTSCGETQQETCKRLDKTAQKYLLSNDYQKAISTWTELLAIKPNAPDIYQQMGDCYHKMAEYRQALEAYGKLIQLRPEDWKTWYKIAKIQLSLANVPKAEDVWEKIKSHINSCDALIFHGDLLLLKGEDTKAEHAYRQTLAKCPRNQTAMIRLAVCLAGKGENAKADKVFKTLSDLSPQSTDILLQMSNFCSITVNERAAQLFINKAIKLKPHNQELQIKLAKFYLETGRHDQAVTTLKKFLQSRPKNHYAKKMIIEAYLLSSRCREAGQYLNSLTEREQKRFEFQLLKGKYYLNSLNLQAAIAQFQEILNNEPNIPLVHYLLSLSYLAAGMNNLGQKNLIKCLTLNPEFTEAELTLADTYFKSRDYDLALKHVNRVKKREPENYRCYMISGSIHLARGEYQTALADFQDALYLYPEKDTSTYYTALCAYHSGNTPKAVEFLQNILADDLKFADAATQYAKILYSEGKGSQAIKYLEQAIKSEPQNPYLHYIIGELYFATSKRQEAIDEFNKSLSLKSDLESAYTRLFDLYADNKKQLKEYLTAAIDHNSSFYEAYIKLAELYRNDDLPVKAIATLENALKTNPHNPYLANNLAWLYIQYQPESIDKALDFAQTAYEKLPNNPATVDTLGWIYYHKNMLTRAAWLLAEAEDLAPDNELIQSHLHDLHAR